MHKAETTINNSDVEQNQIRLAASLVPTPFFIFILLQRIETTQIDVC